MSAEELGSHMAAAEVHTSEQSCSPSERPAVFIGKKPCNAGSQRHPTCAVCILGMHAQHQCPASVPASCAVLHCISRVPCVGHME
jgi:hypothetical protein